MCGIVHRWEYLVVTFGKCRSLHRWYPGFKSNVFRLTYDLLNKHIMVPSCSRGQNIRMGFGAFVVTKELCSRCARGWLDNKIGNRNSSTSTTLTLCFWGFASVSRSFVLNDGTLYLQCCAKPTMPTFYLDSKCVLHPAQGQPDYIFHSVSLSLRFNVLQIWPTAAPFTQHYYYALTLRAKI